MGKKQVERGERTSNDGDGDSSGGGANKQGNPITQSYALKGSDKVMTELPDERVTVKDVLLGRATKAELATQVKGGMSEQSEAVKVLMTNAQVAYKRKLLLLEKTWQEIVTPSKISQMGLGNTVSNWHGMSIGI